MFFISPISSSSFYLTPPNDCSPVVKPRPLPFAPTLVPRGSAHPLATGEGAIVRWRLPLQAMVSLPGRRRSLKVCMLMTSSVFTRAGGGALCLSRRWHLRDTLSSSTTALQKDLWGDKKTEWVPGAHPVTPVPPVRLGGVHSCIAGVGQG